MDEQESKVIQFPLHRRGTIADTLRGFPARDGGPAWDASRREQLVSLVVADLRGHERLAPRVGEPAALAAVRDALSEAIAVLRSHGGQRIAVGGGDAQPVVCAEFVHPGHAIAAVVAATDLRDTVHVAPDAIEACVGVNTGAVVEATLAGGTPIVYRAMATVRMFAVRLQEFAGPGQIFVSASTVAELGPAFAGFSSIGEVRTNAGGETTEAFALLELSAAARQCARIHSVSGPRTIGTAPAVGDAFGAPVRDAGGA
jgi:class 3 adenylate cyclase